jgi:hypothetical protein
LIADFEGDTYGDWKVIGNRFLHGPVSRHLAQSATRTLAVSFALPIQEPSS